MTKVSAYLALLFICSNVISLKADIGLEGVSNTFGGLNGGGYFELRSWKNLRPTRIGVEVPRWHHP